MRKIKLTKKFFLLLFFVLQSCSNYRGVLEPRFYFDDHLELPLIPFPSPQGAISGVQSVYATIDQNQKILFTAQFELASNRSTIVWFIAMGPRVLTVANDNHQVVYERHRDIRLPIDPLEVLFCYQLAFWPLSQLQASLPPNTSIAEESLPSRTRILIVGGKPRYSVSYQNETDWIGQLEIKKYGETFLEIDTLQLSR